ncbi:MAG: hypothetical protein HN742_20780 [Lentisphaerae bacterium]|nr:hypothetical protein [Lentisphaerota bacterium]MBT4818335.1 hypothetical protein [Lentisphaerota bacterium]MBT5610698.1 hypothetical protein [Lentisphaerota bacterium]MBT7054267.1 hypothetical protein [Lentisphaerota bacterium]MBT7844328.1 hypothetical protein [Lentisphaerota bacterium]
MKTNLRNAVALLLLVGAGTAVGAEPVEFRGASWIWHPADLAKAGRQPPECTRYFRRVFTLPDGGSASAFLAITADNEWSVYVNGRLVGEGDPGAASWYQPRQFDISALLTPGRNTVAVEATNILPGPAGLLVRCVLRSDTGAQSTIDTDSGWRSREQAERHWESADLDDSAWPTAKVVAPYGKGAWGTRLRPALMTALADPLLFDGAQWIWFPGDLDEPGESPPACSRFFRAVLVCPEETTVRQAQVIVTADNEWVVFLNGRLIDEGEQGGAAWHRPRRLDVTHLIRPGENVLAIQATNILPGAAGLIAKLRIATANGAKHTLATDSTWQCSDTVQKGWQKTIKGDRGWVPATAVAPYGRGPWGLNLSLPRAVPLADPVELQAVTLGGALLFLQGNVPKPHHFAFTATGPNGRPRSWQSRAYPENDVPAPAILGRKLCLLPSANPEAEARVLIDAGAGSIGSPSVSFDGKTIYFAMAPEGEGFYHIYCLPASGSAPARKLTDGPFHDYDPEPLPDGRIAFSSTRIGSREEYHANLASSIFAMDAGGTGIHPLTYHIVSDREPRASADGGLVVVRSDNFMDRAKVETQLHRVRCDGTGGTVLLGNDRGTIGYNAGYGSEGPVRPGLLRQNGFGSPAPLPDGRVAALSKDGLVVTEPEAAQGRRITVSRDLLDISPLPDGRLLATSLDRQYLGTIDLSTGGFSAFHRSLTRDAHSVVFLGPRKRPPVTASVLRSPQDRDPERTGYLYCQSVFRSKQEQRLRGRVRAVRVFEGVPLALRPDHYHYLHIGVEAVELGTVPLAEDGSFHIEVPADRALALQAVDAEGRAVVNELSWIYVRPGERRSCVGCHSHRVGAPPSAPVPLASAGEPVPLLGRGTPYRFRGNNPELGGILNLQFDRFREAAAIDLYPESGGSADGAPVTSARMHAIDLALVDLCAGRTGLRISAAQRLAVLRDRRAVPALTVALRDRDASVRANAALALAACGDRSCLDPLQKTLSDSCPNAARAAHLALGNLTGHTVPFRGGGERDRRQGIWEWDLALKAGWGKWLENRLDDLAGDETVEQLRAIRALGHLGGDAAGEALRVFIAARLAPDAKGSDIRGLMAALRALGTSGNGKAVPFLAGLINLETRKGSTLVRRRNMYLAATAAEALGRIGGTDAERALLAGASGLQEFWEYSRLSGDHPVLVACHSSVIHFRILEALDAIGSTDARVVPVFLRSVPGDLDRGLLIESDSYENLVGQLVSRTGQTESVSETCLGMLGADGMRVDEGLQAAISAYPMPLSHRGKTLEQLYRNARRGLTCLPYVPEMRAAQILSIVPATDETVRSMVATYRRYRKQATTTSLADYPQARTRAWVCFYLARALGRTGDAAAARELLDALHGGPRELDTPSPRPPHPMVYEGITPFHRAAAAYAVGRLRPAGAVDALLAITGDLVNALDVRHSAAKGLACAAMRSDVEAIRALAEAYPEVGTRRMLHAAAAAASNR